MPCGRSRDTVRTLETVDRGITRFCQVPEGRWPGWDPGSSAAPPPRAAFIKGIEEFDARFFGISPRMAAWMDPQHRILLELAWQAVENAALNPDDLAGSPVAVFVGACMSDYRERMNSAKRVDSAAFSGTLMSFSANRVSYQSNWTGPSMISDSACSSGLTALGLAVRGLQAGEYPMALVGAPTCSRMVSMQALLFVEEHSPVQATERSAGTSNRAHWMTSNQSSRRSPIDGWPSWPSRLW
ncbi:polyketide synthase [Streptomyces sp. FIT100]|uniref:beta-ketoacyl [acyl carrier protein] synthase domain-containing protein n=1 Tax=Streptomyces sp. FIT100 TaxID=2837956 RepID=UPI0021C87077|nr:polyketide synthase [Streptomyces sp. FIT100]UUN26589.1 polyketide synthase [Streptomyces sp. FIT100]